MSPEPTVGIVIVNYNGRRFLGDCVRALCGGTRTDFEVVLVDNGSIDGSPEEILREFPQVILLPQDNNVGVAAGNNVGIEYCRQRGCPYILLLNYDTIPEPTLLDELLASAQPGVLVSGYTLFWDDPTRSNSHAGGFDWLLGRLREPFFGNIISDTHALHDVEIADTCCLLVPRSTFDAIGMMDTAYFMYYDDTDFVVRARRAGYRCVLNPRARLRHYERGATGSTSLSPVSVYYTTRNRPYFMSKHSRSSLKYWGFLLYFATTRTVNLIMWIVSGQFHRASWMVKGLADFVYGRMGPGYTSRRRAGASA